MALETSTSILRSARRKSDVDGHLRHEAQHSSCKQMILEATQDLESRYDKWIEVFGKELHHVKSICRDEQQARQQLEARYASLERIVEDQLDEIASLRTQLEKLGHSQDSNSCQRIENQDKLSLSSVVLHRHQGKDFGIQLASDNGHLVVTAIIAHSPAAEDGRLAIRDRILEINGESTHGMLPGDAADHIRWAGHTLMLEVARPLSCSESRTTASKQCGYASKHSTGAPLAELSTNILDTNEDKRVRFTHNISRKYFSQEDVSLSVSRGEAVNSPMRGDDGARLLHHQRLHQSHDMPDDSILDGDENGSYLQTPSPAHSSSGALLDMSLPYDEEAHLPHEAKESLTRFRDEYPQHAMRYIVLTKHDHETGFGFSIEQHNSDEYDGVVISAIRPNTAASRCCHLRQSDQIFEIEGTDVRCLTTRDVVEFLGDFDDSVSMIVARPKRQLDDASVTSL